MRKLVVAAAVGQVVGGQHEEDPRLVGEVDRLGDDVEELGIQSLDPCLRDAVGADRARVEEEAHRRVAAVGERLEVGPDPVGVKDGGGEEAVLEAAVRAHDVEVVGAPHRERLTRVRVDERTVDDLDRMLGRHVRRR